MSGKFKTIEDALRFAFHYSGQSYERPIMNRMADDPVRTFGESMGLSGNDGAGQAGMLWNQVMRLSDMSQFVLYAAYSPRSAPCNCGRPCCSGYKPNPFWEACIVKIEEAAITRALAGCISHRTLRRQIVRRLFGDKSIVLQDVAARCEVAQNTASNHNQAIKGWLFGSKEDGWTSGVRPRAVAQLDVMLAEAGVVESAFVENA
jgi:hypothetical protein